MDGFHRETLEARFWASTSHEVNGCRLWRGNVSNGHARFRLRKAEQPLFGRRDVSAHLVAWWLAYGSHEPFVDRTCGNTLCVEPTHLEARSLEARFWRNVDRTTTPDGCWPWLGGTSTFGYGSTSEGQAHRVAYRLTYGDIQKGLVVRHKCHNPICCRPDHLVTGTQRDNIEDAVVAGRMKYARGERVNFAKFSDRQAAALRTVYLALREKQGKQNASLAVLAALLDVAPRTVWRIVKGIGYTTAEAAEDLTPAGEGWSSLDDVGRRNRIDMLVHNYRLLGFPWATIEDDKNPIAQVAASKVAVKDDVIVSVGNAGQRTCLAAHPQRLRAKHAGQYSVVEAFEDDKTLTRALRYQLDRGDPVTPRRVLRALMALVRAPRNFPPALARWIADEYAPSGGVVLDPCSGYGGRLLGVMASVRQVSYIGFDIEPENAAGNLGLARRLEVEARARQELRAVEDPAEWPTVDVVLTSPPYYNLEDYGAAARGRLLGYPSYEAWREGFLRTLIERALRAAPIVVLNVARTSQYDLPADAAGLAAALGGVVERTLTWPLRAFGKYGRAEKILVLRRG